MARFLPRPIRRLPFLSRLPSRAEWEVIALRTFGYLLLISLTSYGQAMERWSFPDFRDDDKQKHLAAGAAIATVTDFTLREYAPRMPAWKRVIVDSAVATAAGIAKEVWDDRCGPKRDTCDPADAIATSLGGCAAAVSITCVWRF